MFYLLILFIFISIFQFINLIITITKKDKKKWGNFFGIYIAYLIGFFLYYILSDKYEDLVGGSGMLLIFVVAILLNIINGLNFIIGFIIFIIQNKKKKLINNLNTNKSFLKSIIISSLVIISIVVVTYFIQSNPILDKKVKIKKNAIEYLNKKYGNQNFRIIYTFEDFSYNGFSNTGLEGYNFYIRSDITKKKNIFVDYYFEQNEYKDNFMETLYDIDIYDENILADNNLHNLDVFLKDKYLLDSIDYYNEYFVEDYVLPDDFGRIPNKNEYTTLIGDFLINNCIELIVDNNSINYEFNNIETINNYLDNIKLENGEKLSVKNNKIYKNNEIIKSYNTEEELIKNIYTDLCKLEPKVELEIIRYYYTKLAKSLSSHYSDRKDMLFNLKYYGTDYHNGYILFKNNKIYIDATSNLDYISFKSIKDKDLKLFDIVIDRLE